MHKVSGLIPSHKNMTFLKRLKKILTFPLWQEISVGVGHAIIQPQKRERKMCRLMII
jgi:hypothetical protein